MRHSVIVAEPHPHSMASAVLLNRMLRTCEINAWLKFREGFLARRKAQDGTLKCHYCGKSNLIADAPWNATKSQLNQLATIDHVKPKSKGGNNDESNLVVACFKCNQRKADNELGS